VAVWRDFKPIYIPEDIWLRYLEHVMSERFTWRSQSGAGNRNQPIHGSVTTHTDGSVSFAAHAKRMVRFIYMKYIDIWQQLPQSPKNLQTDIFGRYYTLTDNFTNGLNPSVFYSAYHNDRRMYRRISSSVFQTFTKNCIDGFNPSVCHTITDGINSSVYFKRETFFGVQVPYVKSSANVFFYFSDWYSDEIWYYWWKKSQRTFSVGKDAGK